MSVQLIKWIILFVTVCVVSPDVCRADIFEPLCKAEITTGYTIDNSSNKALHSLVSLFRIRVADLAEEISHFTIDKKSFIHLFLYQRCNSYHSFAFTDYRQISQHLFFICHRQTAYYVYALRKIIV